jgi:hypothetical protein
MKDDGMGGQVDILNTDYSKLPQKWQAENEAQAVAAINLVMKAGNDAKKQLESLAAEVHEQWLSRNTWAKDGPLGVSYGELPEEEKQKDRDVILQAIEVLALNNLSPLPEEMPEEMSEEMPEEMPEDDKYQYLEINIFLPKIKSQTSASRPLKDNCTGFSISSSKISSNNSSMFKLFDG